MKRNANCALTHLPHAYFTSAFAWGGFATTQRHDKMKNAYALKNGIELVRIPYKPTFTEGAKSVKGKLAPLIGNGQSKPL
jgi:hypothetical protein